MTCVKWSSKSKTTKGLRYIQIRENSVRENPHINIEHVSGKINPADMFSKEDKDTKHFQQLRNMTVKPPVKTVVNKVTTNRLTDKNQSPTQAHPCTPSCCS